MRVSPLIPKALYINELSKKKIFVFECGSGRGGGGKHATSIVHAHIHLAPTDMPVLDEVHKSGLYPAQIESNELIKHYGQHPYMLYIDQKDNWYITSDPNTYFPRQHPRQVLADYMGLEKGHYNWRKYPMREKLDSIAKEIYTFLRNEYEHLPTWIQEAVKKIQELPDEIRKNSTFHFIGHLQTNKVEKVVEYFEYIDSVDSLKLAREISKSACRLNKSERILLQVNNAGEEQKSGYSKQQLREDFPEILKLDSIEICGLMNMAPIDASGEELSALFADVRKFRDELENEFEIKLPELSMGMTNDYKFAVKEGATMIRLGRKLFTK